MKNKREKNKQTDKLVCITSFSQLFGSIPVWTCRPHTYFKMFVAIEVTSILKCALHLNVYILTPCLDFCLIITFTSCFVVAYCYSCLMLIVLFTSYLMFTFTQMFTFTALIRPTLLLTYSSHFHLNIFCIVKYRVSFILVLFSNFFFFFFFFCADGKVRLGIYSILDYSGVVIYRTLEVSVLWRMYYYKKQIIILSMVTVCYSS